VITYDSLDTGAVSAGYRAGAPMPVRELSEMAAMKPDLLHVHCPFTASLIARSLREMSGAPIVFTWHTKYDIDVRNTVPGELLQNTTIRMLIHNVSACDEVWTVSEGAGRNLRSLGFEGDYKVVLNGVDFQAGRADEALVEKAVKGYDLPVGIPVFLYVGRMMNYKNLPLIIDALKMLSKDGKDFRMIFAGGGIDLESVIRKAHESGIAVDDFSKPIPSLSASEGKGKIIFAGPIYERDLLRGLNTKADLFLFPSTFDTNGLVVREAAAASLPSVLVADSCAAEGITTFKNGFLINENASSMAAMLAKIIEHPELLSYVRSRVADDLYVSWEDAIRKAHERYQIVIDNFKSGKYPPHKRPTDEFYKMAGSLVDLIAQYGSKEEPEYE
jgi:glycosyltransferase involved in cell wall biosynthesis